MRKHTTHFDDCGCLSKRWKDKYDAVIEAWLDERCAAYGWRGIRSEQLSEIIEQVETKLKEKK